MREKISDPIRPTDDEARQIARDLLDRARFGALGVIDPDSGGPMVTRVAVGTSPERTPLLLVSTLSAHTGALRANPACSLLLGEPGPKGDPLTHPRLSLQATARFVPRDAADHPAMRDRWLRDHPKAKLYIDFGDFGFVRLETEQALLNGGFGKAYRLGPEDLVAPG
ncbi:pyridoxamine 5'-phosphate oxidase family protein [Tropicimonas sp. TH_r6]|uniref:HugZ family pyridoxamine 5'-phosphate oxidase n=1 Tax=Tropicimonas sp. TH_r6 TaxID=3082085 RepID=UPI0029534A4C|nr:pyridoxamine 5'-phosphate oxidase family protein [Tropicimonas sp. TH_r6]MDV7142321.1 pyridoxamine 5'-phosphate oxidase family protein [Tropicimonas sp. TH_r6]